jgi:hypothetical protein
MAQPGLASLLLEPQSEISMEVRIVIARISGRACDLRSRRLRVGAAHGLERWRIRLSSRIRAQVLGEFLPPSNGAISPATVRRHTLAVGQRLDMRATEPDEYDCLALQRNGVPSSARLTVAIDGAYIRANGSVATPALRCRRTNRAEWTIGRSVCLGGSGPSQAQGFHEGGSR